LLNEITIQRRSTKFMTSLTTQQCSGPADSTFGLAQWVSEALQGVTSRSKSSRLALPGVAVCKAQNYLTHLNKGLRLATPGPASVCRAFGHLVKVFVPLKYHFLPS